MFLEFHSSIETERNHYHHFVVSLSISKSRGGIKNEINIEYLVIDINYSTNGKNKIIK